MFYVISWKIALPIILLRYAFHSAGSAQGAASRRRPCTPVFRERLNDVEAASTGSFSRASGLINGWLHGPCRPGKAYAATRRKCRYVIL
ncbi:hypothetical protein, partial [Klebsiella quasipneumoniae]|uniref:hypothetical protein n=1 Tax=Klebsiella quasipneumoniae TaxID=1463165 RepID=UPI001B350037